MLITFFDRIYQGFIGAERGPLDSVPIINEDSVGILFFCLVNQESGFGQADILGSLVLVVVVVDQVGVQVSSW